MKHILKSTFVIMATSYSGNDYSYPKIQNEDHWVLEEHVRVLVTK